jgi:hypothetical protein
MFLVSLFSSLLLFFESRPSTNGVGMGFATSGVSQVEVDYPRALDLPKGRPESYRLVAGLMISYKYVRGMIV